MPRHDVLVVEGVDQHGTRLIGESASLDQSLIHGGAVEPDIRAIPARRLDLRDRGVDRHEDGHSHVEQLTCERHPLRVVTGARSDYSASTLVIRQLSDAVVGTADFERAGTLQVLRDQIHGPTHLLGQPSSTLDRQRAHNAVDTVRCAVDVTQFHRRIVALAYGSARRPSGNSSDERRRACDAAVRPAPAADPDRPVAAPR